jgi:hypothetical protein
LRKFNRRSGAAGAEICPWSSAETWNSLAATDLVLIPAMLDEQWTVPRAPTGCEALWAAALSLPTRFLLISNSRTVLAGADVADGIAGPAKSGINVGEFVRACAASRQCGSPTASPQWEQILEMA